MIFYILINFIKINAVVLYVLGHTDVLKAFITHSARCVNATDKSGKPPLFHAAYRGQIDCVNTLLETNPKMDLTVTSGPEKV